MRAGISPSSHALPQATINHSELIDELTGSLMDGLDISSTTASGDAASRMLAPMCERLVVAYRPLAFYLLTEVRCEV
jgi:hypothetical protein